MLDSATNPILDVDYDETTEDLMLQAVEAISEGITAETMTARRGKVLIAKSFLEQALNQMPAFGEMGTKP